MPHSDRRSVALEGGSREVELPVDGLGRHRFRGRIDRTTITRAVDDGDGSIGFKGHAALFGTRTWIGPKRWGFWESIDRGAFAKTLAEADVRMLINHNPDLLLARSKGGEGTLRLAEDAVGLAVDADMAPVSYAQDLAVLMERGDLTQMSFAFEPITYRWEEMADGTDHFIHTEVRLWDVSPVTYPAYEDTDAGLRALALEVMCRKAGIDPAAQRRLLSALADGDDDTVNEIVAPFGAPFPRLAAFRAADPIENAPAETTRSECPPAETTGATSNNPNQTVLRHLAQRMASLEDHR